MQRDLRLKKLTDNEIHIWHANPANFKNGDTLNYFASLLNKDEIKQKNQFYFDDLQHHYLITRALVRIVLSKYISYVKPEEWQFSREAYGKPFIANPKLADILSFNISHTPGAIVLALVKKTEIGIDIENIDRKTNIKSIYQSAFSSEEILLLENTPLHHKKKLFYRLWTLKEAYVKAKGLGLSLSFNQFSFSFPSNEKILISFNPLIEDQPHHWQFIEYELYHSYYLSLAVKLTPHQNCYHTSLIPFTDHPYIV